MADKVTQLKTDDNTANEERSLYKIEIVVEEVELHEALRDLYGFKTKPIYYEVE